MLDNYEINIVDAICGAGKTEAIIDLINKSDIEDKFIVVTPYLDEIERYRDRCKNKNFKQPSYSRAPTKKQDLKKLIQQGENIVTTHAMFQRFDNELIEICRAADYTLIMDEVANVVELYDKIKKDDFQMLMNDKYISINEDSGIVEWDNNRDYDGDFNYIRTACNLNSLVVYGGQLLVWLFPIEAFNAFRITYILTYMFNCQMQRYYYDYYNMKYKYWSVKGTFGNHHLVEYDPTISYIKYDYKKLIHIIDNDRLNKIGDREQDLSKAWFERNQNNIAMNTLKNNMLTFFRRIRNDNSADNLWTTFLFIKNKLKGHGNAKCFLSCNARATNEYKDRSSVAYMVNRYMNPVVKNFFSSHNIKIDEDSYALSEILQFIWRSAIRDGNEIWVYIPSIRMRTLLENWIKENSLNTDN